MNSSDQECLVRGKWVVADASASQLMIQAGAVHVRADRIVAVDDYQVLRDDGSVQQVASNAKAWGEYMWGPTGRPR